MYSPSAPLGFQEQFVQESGQLLCDPPAASRAGVDVIFEELTLAGKPCVEVEESSALLSCDFSDDVVGQGERGDEALVVQPLVFVGYSPSLFFRIFRIILRH